MSRLLLLRVVVAATGVLVWGYGYRTNAPDVRLAAIGILAVALLLRFAPRHWFGDR
jgi:hypothetical protein